MTSLDRWMNGTVPMSESPYFLKREVLPRVALVGIIPLELGKMAFNIIKLPFQAVTTVVKIPAWTISKFVDSHSLDQFQQSMSGPLAMIFTAFRVIGCALGVLSSLTLGVLSPKSNFRFQVALGLVVDERALALMKKKELEDQEQDKKDWDKLQSQVQNILDTEKIERRKRAA
jgi:hypothetical protein